MGVLVRMQPRHRHRVAASLSKRCGKNLDDPEAKRYRRYLRESPKHFFVHFGLDECETAQI
jgi:hypothetical protein